MDKVVIILFLFVLAYIYVKYLDYTLLRKVTNFGRGTRSERNLVTKLLKNGIPEQTIFHDLYIEIGNSKYCQIDLVVATRAGIIVFEIKDYSGWIFGSANQKQWTQLLAYGRVKNRFYNPIMQNEKHIYNLKKQLQQFQNIPFFSVIVFYGDCEFKNDIYVPENTFIIYSKNVMNVVQKIMEKEPAPYTNKREIVELLKRGAINGEQIEIRNEHVRYVRSLVKYDQ